MHYPQRSIDEILFKIANAMFISTMDMPMGYMQVEVRDEDQQYNAFTTHDGAYSFRRMSFGLKNAAFTLACLLDMVFYGLRAHTENYHDDVYVFSPSADSHLTHLQTTFEALIQANIVISVSKAKLFSHKAHILGHIVGNGFIRPCLDKTIGIRQMKPPKNRTGVRSFLGMTSFFRKFIKGYAAIAQPLTRLTSDNVPWEWSGTQDQDFNALKAKLCEDPVLRAPDYNNIWYLSLMPSKKP